MCGRFSLTKEEAEIEKRFQAKFYTNDLVKRYNVAPSQLSLVMTDAQPEKLQLFKWGLIPSWAKDKSIGYKMINARSETVFEKPSFKKLIKQRRCLVIADSFYEWQPLGGKKKQPFRIGLKSWDLFAFAGLWDEWADKETGEIIPTFTILTTAANSLVSPIHDRMPVILEPEEEKRWLKKGINDQEILELLSPFPESEMMVYPVSEQVNSPANDNPGIIEPVS
ncbi:MAG: SOS response-associated peptidase [Bacteroidetes bacterium]|nr:SOS response-associated peptidase [Bacteroidota bacterium]